MEMLQVEEADICNKNEITYCLGGGNLKYGAGIFVRGCIALNHCKRVLLSSDGIHEYVSIDELEDFILGDITQKTMKKVADRARANGSDDDKKSVTQFGSGFQRINSLCTLNEDGVSCYFEAKTRFIKG